MSKKWMNGLAILAFVLLATGGGCTTGHVPAEKSDKAAVAAPAASTQPSFVFKTPRDKLSYSLGVDTVRSLKQRGVEINMDAMTQGMKDAMAGDKLLVSDDEIRMNIAAIQSDVRSRQARAKLMTAMDNKKEGEAFLTENKTKEGVVALPSGLQYKILKAGNGPKPVDGDVVECYYLGTLINGMEFDSSARGDNEGGPAMFKISDVIPGWREALKLMPVGSKWRLFIPPSLAYGQRGAGGNIGPYATLIFEVELVAIK